MAEPRVLTAAEIAEYESLGRVFGSSPLEISLIASHRALDAERDRHDRDRRALSDALGDLILAAAGSDLITMKVASRAAFAALGHPTFEGLEQSFHERAAAPEHASDRGGD